MNKKLKVLFMIGSLDGGGAERVISILANNFVKFWDVKILAVYKDVVKYNLDSKVNYEPLIIPAKDKRITRNLKRILAIRERIKTYNPDIVISFLSSVNIFTLIATRKIKVPVIVSERSVPNYEITNKLIRLLRDTLYYHSKDCFFVFQTEYIKGLYKEKIKRHSRVIYNPIKEDLPAPYVGIREKRVVCVARLDEVKNIPMLLKAFKKFSEYYPDYILELYGKGVLYDKLTNQVNSLGLKERVRFMGFSKTIHRDIYCAKMFVLPSNYEGLSNALIEAEAMGIPVISTDCPAYGARLFIKQGVNGYLIPVNSEKELVYSMKNIADDVLLDENIRSMADKIRKRLDVSAITNEWKAYIGEVIENCSI